MRKRTAPLGLPKRVYFVTYENGELASEEVFRTREQARRDIAMHFKTTERVVSALVTPERPFKSRNHKDPTP